MRVLHVIVTMARGYGGPVAACDAYCQHLVAMGHQVTVFTTDMPWPPGPERDGPLGRTVTRAGYDIVRFHALERFVAWAPALWRALDARMLETDIVHIHGSYRFPGYAAAVLARRHGVPFIMCPHGSLLPYGRNQPHSRWRKRIYEQLFEFPNLRRAAAVQFTAEDERLLTKPLGFDAKAVVIPCAVETGEAVDPCRFEPPRSAAPADGPTIVFMGRLAKKKNAEVAIEALPQVLRTFPGARLVVAGPDDEGLRPGLEAIAARLAVADRVVFPGMVGGQAKERLLRDGDVFVLPSHSENFGIAVIEAMAAGLPTIVTRGVAIWREVEESGGGLVVDNSAQALSEGIIRILSEPDLASRRAAAIAFANRFTGPRVTEQLVDVYRRVIAERDDRTIDRDCGRITSG